MLGSKEQKKRGGAVVKDNRKGEREREDCYITYRLHQIAPLKRLVLLPAHRHPLRPRPPREALVHAILLQRAVLQRRTRDAGFTLLVVFQHIRQPFLVRFDGPFDFRERSVVGPEVREAAIWVEGWWWWWSELRGGRRRGGGRGGGGGRR